LEVLVLFSAFGGIDDTSDTIEDARGVLDGNWGELSAQLSQTTKAVKESTELEVLIRKSGELLLRSSPSPSSTTAGLSSTDNATDTSEDGTNRLDACAEEAAPTKVFHGLLEFLSLKGVQFGPVGGSIPIEADHILGFSVLLAGLDNAANTVENSGKGLEAEADKGAELHLLSGHGTNGSLGLSGGSVGHPSLDPLDPSLLGVLPFLVLGEDLGGVALVSRSSN